MKFFGAILLLALATYQVEGGVLVGVDKCTWGPSYWCKDISAAKTCNTIQHCKQQVWTKPIQNDEVCEICKEGMEMVDNYLKKQGTKPEIKAALSKICTEIPVSTLSSECTKLVDADFDLIYDELLMMLADSDVVCSAMGLCTSEDTRNDLIDIMAKQLPGMVKEAYEKNMLPVASVQLIDDVSKPSKAVGSSYCAHCHAFMGDVQSVIMNNQSIVKEWENLIKMECKSLGPGLSEVCQTKLQQATYTMLHNLQTDESIDTICTTIMMCNSGSNIMVQDGNNMCTDCKNFFADWQDIIKNNKSIIDALNKLVLSECKQLEGLESMHDIVKKMAALYCLQKPSDLQKECVHYVSIVIENCLNRIAHECENLASKYLPDFWQLIAETSPEEVCTEIYFCNSEVEATNEITTTLEENLEDSSKYCTDCTNFMKDLQDIARNNQTIVSELTDLIKDQCDQLGPEIADLCKMQISKVVENLLPQFENLDVNTICTTILMCTSSPQSLLKANVGDDVCTHCTAFFQDWQEIIQNNQSTIDQLNSLIADQCNNLGSDYEKLDNLAVQLVDQYCNQYPFFLKSECKDALTKLVNQLITTIPQADAEQICSTLYFCDFYKIRIPQIPKKVVVEEIPKVEVNNPVTCTVCKIVVHELDKMLEGNTTAAAAEKALEKVCSYLPADISQECKDFVEKYGDEVIDMIINEVESGIICSTLLLCESKVTIKKPIESSIPCTVCMDVVKVLDSWLQKNSTEAEIQEALEKVCNVLPASIKTECDQLVSEYGPAIIDLLANDITPTEVCSKLGLCSNTKVTVSADTCSLCTEVVGVLENLIEESSTEAEIEAALEKVCGLLPSSIKEECDTLIEQYGPEIISLLVSKLPPQELCKALKLCHSYKKIESSIPCTVCMDVVKVLDSWLQKNSTESEIEEALEKVCNVLPSSIKTECEQLVTEYGPVIVELLANEITPTEVCSKLSLCSNTKVTVSADTCPLCTEVVGVLENLIEEGSTEAEIEAALEKVCGLLPSSIKEECDTLIEQYGPEIISLLVSKLPPQELCKALKLCHSYKKIESSIPCTVCMDVVKVLDSWLQKNSTESEIEEALEKVCNVLPASIKSECDQLITEYGPVIVDLLANDITPTEVCSKLGLCSNTKVTVSADTCSLCTEVVGVLENLIEEGSTEAEIEAALEKVCGLLPSSVEEECDTLIEQYGPAIISLLVNKLPPQEICKALKLCTSYKHIFNYIFNAVSADNCALCSEIVGVLDNLLEKNSTEAEIIAAVEKVCSILPSSIKSECSQLVEQYGQLIIELLTNGITPKELCTELGLCPKSYVGADSTCVLCEFIVQELDKIISKNSTEAEIVKAVEGICNVLPSSLKTECDSFIHDNGDALVKLLLQQIAPEKLCTELKACTTKVKSLSKDSLECEACHFVFEELSKVLTANSTKEEVLKELETVCDKVKGQLHDMCIDLVKEYTPEILSLLANIDDPDYMCLHLKLCPEAQKMLGVNHCTFGPSYWCKNKQTAIECNALSHCTNHVWD